jgi:hypothetical protein
MKPIAKLLWSLLALSIAAYCIISQVLKNELVCESYFGDGATYFYQRIVKNGRIQKIFEIPDYPADSAAFDMLLGMEPQEKRASHLINQAYLGSCEEPPPNAELRSIYHFSVNPYLLKRLAPKYISTSRSGSPDFVGVDVFNGLDNPYLSKIFTKHSPVLPDFIFLEFDTRRDHFEFTGFLKGNAVFSDLNNMQVLIISRNSYSPTISGNYMPLVSFTDLP